MFLPSSFPTPSSSGGQAWCLGYPFLQERYCFWFMFAAFGDTLFTLSGRTGSLTNSRRRHSEERMTLYHALDAVVLHSAQFFVNHTLVQSYARSS